MSRFLSEVEVRKNTKTKVYSDGTTNTIACRAAIFKDSSYVDVETLANQDFKYKLASEHCQNILDYLEAKQTMDLDEYIEVSRERKKELARKKAEQRFKEEKKEVRNDSMKRAKDSIFDYILNNDFQYFFTGTINPDKLNSKEPKELLKPVQKWLNHMVERYGLRYVMIAERHKKGGIHFHGLLYAEIPLKLIDSGTKLYIGHKKPISNERAEKLGLSDGRTVYNLKSWDFGFTTCVELTGDRLNTAFYVTKYITKDCKKIFGKFFWHSRNLKKPAVIYSDMDFNELQAVDCGGFKYIFKRGDDNDGEREANASELPLQEERTAT